MFNHQRWIEQETTVTKSAESSSYITDSMKIFYFHQAKGHIFSIYTKTHNLIRDEMKRWRLFFRPIIIESAQIAAICMSSMIIVSERATMPKP